MLVTLGLVALAVFAVDQITKVLVTTTLTRGEEIHVIGDILILQYVKNSGAAFSLASGSTWIFSLIAVCVVVTVGWFARRIRSAVWAIFFGLLLGGTLGNLFDRLFREPSFGLGRVIDFVFTPWLLPAIYNFADIAICTAMALFVVLSLRGVGFDGRRGQRTHGVVEGGTSPSSDSDDGGQEQPEQQNTATRLAAEAQREIDKPGRA
ncbi:signal peptidase II [Rathayibacter toxicus]|uniref:signal peptidase II n=1 Tax=Rathayibacter toxicus TaxID=145458 RepID=UPI00040B0627|nr:signal peptidase II [Rathayibacter toxicus]